MANYKEIQGFPIQNLSSDPVPYAQALADNPYVGNWSSGGNLNTARFWMGGAGTLTAGLVFGGNAPASSATTEKYDGTSWTEVNDLNQARGYCSGCGTQTAALLVSGYGPAYYTQVESFDGTNWTEITDVSNGRLGGNVAGNYTSSIISGGVTASYSNGNFPGVEEWNGSSWTEVAEMNTPRYAAGTSGASGTDALIFGGSNAGGPGNASNEKWNGSAWTELNDLNDARYGISGFGTTTDAVGAGGENPVIASVEQWDGSSWTEVNDLSTARRTMGTSSQPSTHTQGFVAGGYTTTHVATTEEWTFSGLNPSTTPAADYSDAIVGQMYYNSTTGQFKAIKSGGAPIGTWASGGALNTGRNGVRGAGVSKSAVVVFGGNDGSVTGKTENYNGSAWTETTDLNTAKTNSVGTGTYTAAIAAYTSTAETWDGSSWTEVSEMNTPRQEVGSLGIQTSALAIGNQNAASHIVEQWNGSSWTEVGDLTTAVGATTGFGTTSAGHAVGGGNPNAVANNQIWNGSSWSEGADMNQARYFAGASGTTTAGLVFAGYKTSPATEIANTESWDGTSFTEINDLSTARFTGAPAHNSPSTDALLAGGNPSNKNNTEEWTAADFEIKTMTTS